MSCSKPAPTAESAPAVPEMVQEPSTPATTSAPEAEPPPPPPPPPPVVHATEAPRDLEARYFASGIRPDERSEIIRLLGSLATPAAADALLHLFQGEKRMETRLEAMEVMADLSDETCREQKFALLQRASAPAMSKIIRLAALQTLADFDDPRAPAALRAFSSDRDPTIRKQAAEVLKELPAP